MKKVLVTGGTVFVSRYLAEYYIAKGYEVYVLNRNHREQSVSYTHLYLQKGIRTQYYEYRR